MLNQIQLFEYDLMYLWLAFGWKELSLSNRLFIDAQTSSTVFSTVINRLLILCYLMLSFLVIVRTYSNWNYVELKNQFGAQIVKCVWRRLDDKFWIIRWSVGSCWKSQNCTKRHSKLHANESSRVRGQVNKSCGIKYSIKIKMCKYFNIQSSKPPDLVFKQKENVYSSKAIKDDFKVATRFITTPHRLRNVKKRVDFTKPKANRSGKMNIKAARLRLPHLTTFNYICINNIITCLTQRTQRQCQKMF